MKPVELEILLQDSLTPGIGKAGKAFGVLSSQAKAAMKMVKGEISDSKSLIKMTEADIKNLEKAYSKASSHKEQLALKAKIEAAKKALEEQKDNLDYYEKALQKLEGMTVGVRQKLKELTSDIAELSVQYSTMSEAEKNSAEGQALKKHIEELTEEAGALRDAIGDTSDAIRNAASDTRAFDQIAGGLQLVVDGFGLATSAGALFGMSQEDLAEAQTKLQSILVASNALTAMQTQLQSQSAVMQGIATFQTWAAAKAEAVKTAAVGKGIIVTKAATVAQWLFNKAAKANPYVLLAMAVITVVGALVAFAKGSAEAKKAEEERQKQMEKTKEQQEKFVNSVAEAAGEQIAAYNRLRTAWEKLGDSYDKKKKFIEENKKEFEKLGKAVKGVSDAEKFLVDDTEKVVKALVLRAQAAAYDTAITDATKQMIKEQEEARIKSLKPVPTKKRGDELTSGERDFVNGDGVGVEEVRHYTGGQVPGSVQKYTHSTYLYHVDDVGAYNAAYRRAQQEIYQREYQAAEDKAQETITRMQSEMTSTISQLQDLNKELGLSEPGGNGGSGSGSHDDKQDDARREAERREQELARLRRQNRQNEIDQMEEGSEKRRAQIQLDYATEMAAIEEMAAKWKEAQGGTLTDDQSEQITKAYELAQSKMEKSIEEMEAEEVAKSREKIDKLLDQYKDFDQRRRDIDNAYTADMETLNAEKERLEKAGLDTADIESSIHARTESYHDEIKELQSEILQSTDFYDKLFGDVSTKGYKILKDFYAQAQDVMSGAKTTKDGVELTIVDKDSEGKMVKKQVRVTVEEFEKMKKRVMAIKNELEKKNPFAAFRTSWTELTKAMREGGDVTGALQNLNTKGKEVTQTIRSWGDSLGAVFGDRFSKSMNEIMDFCDGAMNMGTGIAQIWSGDIVGGITNALSGLSSIISLFTGWKEKMEEMKRKWYIAEIETNRALREQAEAYAANQSKISDIIDDVETLNWLIEKGYAKPGSVSVWQAQSEALKQYMNDLKEEAKVRDELWEKLWSSEGHYEWGNSLNGGSATWSLRGASKEEIKLWYEQDKLSDAAKAYYEAWVDSGKAVEDLVKNIEDCYAAMQEMVMGVSFDSFLSNARDALKEMRKDISSLGDFTEETLANAILNAFMYQALADMLQPLYDELSEALINGTADAAYLEEWRRRFEETMQDANDRLDMIEKATGVDLDPEGGSSQSGRAGSFNAMSQDQGTKLEGLFTSGQIHWANMDSELEDVASKMSKALEYLMGIEENTGKSAKSLNEILEELRRIIRDGLKVK